VPNITAKLNSAVPWPKRPATSRARRRQYRHAHQNAAHTQRQLAAFGQAKAWTWGNGQAYARSFDQDGRMTSYPLESDLRALSFDAASRIGGITDTAPAANQTLGYDNLDRLTSWVAPATDQSYTYDANGNRTSLTIGASPYGYTVSATSNRLSSVAGPTAKTYSYDAAGHITDNGTRSYLYNPAGFMYASRPDTLPDADVMFWRNGLGQRLIKTAAGVSTLYVYDGNTHLLGEYDGTGAALQETVYLGDQAIGVMQGVALYYVYADHLNTPRLITNTANTPVWRWDSDPFGNNPPNQNPSGLGTFVYNQRLPGQYFDQETGLNYNYFRDYDPSTGRYIESDPIGLNGGSFSTFDYVGGNPVSVADPMGLCLPLCAGAGGAATVGSGAAVAGGAASWNGQQQAPSSSQPFWPKWVRDLFPSLDPDYQWVSESGAILSTSKPPRVTDPAANREWQDYKNQYGEPPPPNLDECEMLRWQLKREQALLAARQAWDAKWGPHHAATIPQSQNAIRNIEAKLKKAGCSCP